MDSGPPEGQPVQVVQDALSRMQVDETQASLNSSSLRVAPDKNKAVPLISAESHPSSGDGTDRGGVRREHQLSDFRPIRKLYRGYASKVYLAEDMGKEKQLGSSGQEVIVPQSGKRVVLKVYDLLRLSPLTKFQLDREVRLHSNISHKHIVGLQAAFSQVCLALQHCMCFLDHMLASQFHGRYGWHNRQCRLRPLLICAWLIQFLCP